MFSKTLIITFLVIVLVGVGLAPQAVLANNCVSSCGGTGPSFSLPCYESCISAENPLIANDCVNAQKIEPTSWTFEMGLGLPVLFGFDPSVDMQIFGWLVVALLSLAGIFALTVLAYAGIRYISSAGSSSGQTAAKSRINNALFGLVLALFSVAGLAMINGSLTNIGTPNNLDRSFSSVVRKSARPVGRCDTSGTRTSNGGTRTGNTGAPTQAEINAEALILVNACLATGTDATTCQGTCEQDLVTNQYCPVFNNCQNACSDAIISSIGPPPDSTDTSPSSIDDTEVGVLFSACAALGPAGAQITGGNAIRCSDSSPTSEFATQCSSLGGTYDSSVGDCGPYTP